MRTKIAKIVDRTEKFVSDHKVAITVVITSVAWYKLHRWVLEDHNEFLKEHGLYDAYYTVED